MIIDKEELLKYLNGLDDEEAIDLEILASNIRKNKQVAKIVSLINDLLSDFKYNKSLYETLRGQSTAAAYIQATVPTLKFPRRYGVSTAIATHVVKDPHAYVITSYDAQRREMLQLTGLYHLSPRIRVDMDPLYLRDKKISCILVDLHSTMSQYKQDAIAHFAIENNIPLIRFN